MATASGWLVRAEDWSETTKISESAKATRWRSWSEAVEPIFHQAAYRSFSITGNWLVLGKRGGIGAGGRQMRGLGQRLLRGDPGGVAAVHQVGDIGQGRPEGGLGQEAGGVALGDDLQVDGRRSGRRGEGLRAAAEQELSAQFARRVGAGVDLDVEGAGFEGGELRGAGKAAGRREGPELVDDLARPQRAKTKVPFEPVPPTATCATISPDVRLSKTTSTIAVELSVRRRIVAVPEAVEVVAPGRGRRLAT